MIFFEDEDMAISEQLKNLAEEAINKSLDYLEFEYECDVTIITTNNEEIQKINFEHRDINKPTDVLSFPLIEWPKPCDYNYLMTQLNYAINPETEGIMIGDIVLSMEKVVSQADEYGHSLEREFAFLIVHSMLHLFGYDHMIDEEEKVMIQLQKDIMETINLKK